MLKFKWINSISLFFIFALVLLKAPFYSFILVFLFWLIITSIGSFHIRWNYHIDALHSNPTISKKQISITFDDGPHAEFTPKILAILKKHKAKATFFCIGKHLEKYPEILIQIINDGHTIGNHSYTHSNYFGFLSTKKIIDELNRTTAIIQKIIAKESLFFRPPYGVTNPAIARALKHTKHQTIGWSIRSLDTVTQDTQQIFKKITKELKAGDVILLHDTNGKAIIVLEQLLLFLQENQFEVVTIDNLFDIEAYA